jgi:hypothetical protein
MFLEGPPVKRLVILDDLEMKGSDRLKNLQVLFRYVSSHKGFSLCLSYQNFFGLEPVIKKVSNIFVVWRPRDRDEIGRIEKRVGLEKFSMLWQKMNMTHTCRSPAPLRLSIADPIEIDDS